MNRKKHDIQTHYKINELNKNDFILGRNGPIVFRKTSEGNIPYSAEIWVVDFWRVVSYINL